MLIAISEKKIHQQTHQQNRKQTVDVLTTKYNMMKTKHKTYPSKIKA